MNENASKEEEFVKELEGIEILIKSQKVEKAQSEEKI